MSVSTVHLDTYNVERMENSANVMGVIRGSVEPGRLCLLESYWAKIPVFILHFIFIFLYYNWFVFCFFNQMNKALLKNFTFDYLNPIHSQIHFVFVNSCISFFGYLLFRQVCDLWEPQGQLGARSHWPQQWHSSDAGDHQSAGKDGEGRWGH